MSTKFLSLLVLIFFGCNSHHSPEETALLVNATSDISDALYDHYSREFSKRNERLSRIYMDQGQPESLLEHERQRKAIQAAISFKLDLLDSVERAGFSQVKMKTDGLPVYYAEIRLPQDLVENYNTATERNLKTSYSILPVFEQLMDQERIELYQSALAQLSAVDAQVLSFEQSLINEVILMTDTASDSVRITKLEYLPGELKVTFNEEELVSQNGKLIMPLEKWKKIHGQIKVSLQYKDHQTDTTWSETMFPK